MIAPLFSCGTSRGGTTFFARMLSLNAEIAMASDPFLPLFRSFRTAVVWDQIDPNFNASLPLGDYYFSPEGIRIMRTLQRSNLDVRLPHGEWEKLLPSLEARMTLAARELTTHLARLGGETYQEIFDSGLALLQHAYGATRGWVGFNDNWVIEFFPQLSRAFPEAKLLVLIRDPRAAVASALKLRDNDSSKASKVPLMYSFAHHWRKHVANTYMMMQDLSLSSRLRIIRYEDLVSDPVKELQELCDFLGVAYEPAMLDTDQFRPVAGDLWEGHSNFSVPQKGIYTESVDAWRAYLPRGTVEFIEFVCDPEMRLFEYVPEAYDGGFPTSAVMEFMQTDDRRAIGWRNQHERWDVECGRELTRKQALVNSDDLFGQQAIEELFLFREVYEGARAHFQN